MDKRADVQRPLLKRASCTFWGLAFIVLLSLPLAWFVILPVYVAGYASWLLGWKIAYGVVYALSIIGLLLPRRGKPVDYHGIALPEPRDLML